MAQTVQTVARRLDSRFVPSWVALVTTPEAKLLRTLRDNDLLRVEKSAEPADPVSHDKSQ